MEIRKRYIPSKMRIYSTYGQIFRAAVQVARDKDSLGKAALLRQQDVHLIQLGMRSQGAGFYAYLQY